MLSWPHFSWVTLYFMTAFSSVTLLVGKQENHQSSKKLYDEVLVWLSVAAKCK